MTKETKETRLLLEQQDNVTVVSFKDPNILSAYHINDVSKDLYDLIDKQGLTRLVIDFSDIRMLSSQTLSVMLTMKQKLDKVNGQIVICGINPQLYRVFKITNLHDVFCFADDRDSAVQQAAK